MSLKRIVESFDDKYEPIDEQQMVEASKTENELAKALFDKVHALQRKRENNIKVYEHELQKVIEKFFPDKSWWEVTVCNIFWSLFEKKDPEQTVIDIIKGLHREFKEDVDDAMMDVDNPNIIAEASEAGDEISEYQKWVDYDMKKYGKISKDTLDRVHDAGFSIVKDQYGDYEVIADRGIDESLLEDIDDEAEKEKLVIYKDLGGYKVTPKSNYGTRISNAKKITDASKFDSAKEIIDYYKKWFGSTDDDFEVIDEGYELLSGTKVKAFRDYNKAKAFAEKNGLKEAEYGDAYGISYCYWNKSGDRNDDEEVIAWYKFSDGKSVALSDDEADRYEDRLEIKFDDLDESLKEAETKTIKRYSDVREPHAYWYFTTHGIGPGAQPKDLHVLATIDGQNEKGTKGTFVALDGVLNTSELKQFDMKEMQPKVIPEHIKDRIAKELGESLTESFDRNAYTILTADEKEMIAQAAEEAGVDAKGFEKYVLKQLSEIADERDAIKKNFKSCSEMSFDDWKALRDEISVGSYMTRDYENSFGLDPKVVANLADGYIEEIQWIAEDRGLDANDNEVWGELDTPEEFANYAYGIDWQDEDDGRDMRQLDDFDEEANEYRSGLFDAEEIFNLVHQYQRLLAHHIISKKISNKAQHKKLTEGTSNFWSMENFPLLVFGDYEDVYDRVYDMTKEQLGDEFDGEVEDTKEFEDNWKMYYDYCVLDEEERGELEDQLTDFVWKINNDDRHDPYEEANVNIKIKPGYYEASQIYVDDEKYLSDWQIEEINKFLNELKDEYGLSQFDVSYRASNGETGYHKVEGLLESYEDFDEYETELIEHFLDNYISVDRRGEASFDAPTYDEVVDEFDDRITQEQYDRCVKVLSDLIPRIAIYEGKLELSDNHTLWNIDKGISEDDYIRIVDGAAEDFEAETGEQVYLLGRSGRHVCVDLTPKNLLNFDELQKKQEELEKQVIADANSIDESCKESKSLKEDKMKYLYTFTDNTSIPAYDEEDAMTKYDRLWKGREGATRSWEEIDKVAQELYDKRDAEGFADFNDEELAQLWAHCQTLDCAYDDEVYDMIKRLPHEDKIFAKADEIFDGGKDESLNERGLTRAERHNRDMEKIFKNFEDRNNRMADFLKAHGVSDEEIIELKKHTGLGKNALDDKMVELGIRDEFFKKESLSEGMLFKPMTKAEAKDFYNRIKSSEMDMKMKKIVLDDLNFFTDNFEKDYGKKKEDVKESLITEMALSDEEQKSVSSWADKANVDEYSLETFIKKYKDISGEGSVSDSDIGRMARVLSFTDYDKEELDEKKKCESLQKPQHIVNESSFDDIRIYMNTWANYNENGADLSKYGIESLADGWLTVDEALEFAEKYAEDEPFINDTDGVPFAVSEYDNAVDVLEGLKELQESNVDEDVVEAIMEAKPLSIQEAVKIAEDGDYYFYPGVDNDTDLAYAVIDEIGSLGDALGDRVTTYIDEDAMRRDYEYDVRNMMYDDAKYYVAEKEGIDEDDVTDEQIEEWIDDNEDRFLDEIIEEEISAAESGDIDLSNYFDYEAFGRDLRFDGYTYTDKGAILIL